jgi:hypothetical protein
MSATTDTTTPTVQPSSVPRRRIPPVAYGVLVIAVFLGVVGLGWAGGVWQTSGGSMGGGRPALVGVSAMEVKGWMAIGDVATTFGVPLEDVLAAFALPADTSPTTALKDLESDLFSVPALREWLAAGGYAAP